MYCGILSFRGSYNDIYSIPGLIPILHCLAFGIYASFATEIGGYLAPLLGAPLHYRIAPGMCLHPAVGTSQDLKQTGVGRSGGKACARAAVAEPRQGGTRISV